MPLMFLNGEGMNGGQAHQNIAGSRFRLLIFTGAHTSRGVRLAAAAMRDRHPLTDRVGRHTPPLAILRV